MPGEYDDKYDLMSTANAFMYRTEFGLTGPGLNGAHLDYLGWLPVDRVVYFGIGMHGAQVLSLKLFLKPKYLVQTRIYKSN